jgi:hypothetical protein
MIRNNWNAAMVTAELREQALLMLDGKGNILDVARQTSALLAGNGIDFAVIGGVAAVLHHHIRTTLDVDIWVSGELKEVADCLRSAGAQFDPAKREFTLKGVPIHLVTIEQTKLSPTDFLDIEEIRTVSLADLISIKLASGISSRLRSQDIADVIGLIRANKLNGKFTPRVAKPFRKEFRDLLKLISTAQ